MVRFFISILCLSWPLTGQPGAPPAVVGAGYTSPTAIIVAPGQVISFFVQGIGANLTKRVIAASMPWPTSLAGISATFSQVVTSPLPILAVQPINGCFDTTQAGCTSRYVAVTVQIPYRIGVVNPSSAALTLNPPGHVVFSENSSIAASVDVIPYVDQVHILRQCDLPMGPDYGFCSPQLPGFQAIAHADGKRVSYSNPAKAGEHLIVYASGLGYVSNADSYLAIGYVPDKPEPTAIGIRVSFDPRPNALASRPAKNDPNTVDPEFAGLIPGFIGLYQINVVVPPLPEGSPRCTPDEFYNRVLTNLTINIIGITSVDGAGICVDPAQ